MSREEEKLAAADNYVKERINEGLGRTGDVFSPFIEGIEWADENPSGAALIHVLNKGVEQGKKEIKNTILSELDKRLKEYQDSGDAYYIPSKRELRELIEFINNIK